MNEKFNSTTQIKNTLFKKQTALTTKYLVALTFTPKIKNQILIMIIIIILWK
jgi:hypothetical protein